MLRKVTEGPVHGAICTFEMCLISFLRRFPKRNFFNSNAEITDAPCSINLTANVFKTFVVQICDTATFVYIQGAFLNASLSGLDGARAMAGGTFLGCGLVKQDRFPGDALHILVARGAADVLVGALQRKAGASLVIE